MYTLYFSPGAASLAVHWLLIDMQLPHAIVAIDFETKQQKTAEYLRLNPSGMVPTLVIDGMPRTECAALLMLLAERHPERNLAPAPNSANRASYLQWMFYFANTLQPAFRAWFYPHEPAGEAQKEAAQAHARLKIECVWNSVDAQLARTAKYVAGDELTTADFLATMLMRWSRNMPKPATAWPHIETYLKHMRAMPSLREVHRREGLNDWIDG